MFGWALALPPLVLKEAHGQNIAAVGRLFLIEGLVTLLCHATVTPYVSARAPVRGAQLLVGLSACALAAAAAAVASSSSTGLVALTVAAYASNAATLGCCNLLTVQIAARVAPLSLATATGATRCAFTAGLAILPLLTTPLRAAAGAWLPTALVAALTAACVPALQVVAAMGKSEPGSGEEM